MQRESEDGAGGRAILRPSSFLSVHFRLATPRAYLPRDFSTYMNILRWANRKVLACVKLRANKILAGAEIHSDGWE
jgi:hypothetical protein